MTNTNQKILALYTRYKNEIPVLNAACCHANGYFSYSDLTTAITWRDESAKAGSFIDARTYAKGLYMPLNGYTLANAAYEPSRRKAMPLARFAVSRERLEWLAGAMSREECRYFLRGVHFDGWRNVFEASDGYRLRQCEAVNAYSVDKSDLPIKIIMPETFIRAVLIAAKKQQDIFFEVCQGERNGDYLIRHLTDEVTIVTKPVDAMFPDTRRFVPDTDAQPHLTCDWRGLPTGTIKYFKALKKHLKDKRLVVTLNSDSATAKAAQGETQQTFNPLAQKTTFDFSYLTDTLRGVMYQFKDNPYGPVIIRAQGAFEVILPSAQA